MKKVKDDRSMSCDLQFPVSLPKSPFLVSLPISISLSLSLSTVVFFLVFRAVFSNFKLSPSSFHRRLRLQPPFNPVTPPPGFCFAPFDLTRMDFARCTDESKESENSSTKCCSKVEAQPEIVELRAPLGPSTPDADRESGDFPSDSKSPLTQVVTSKPLPLTCVDSLGEKIDAPLESFDSFDPLCSPRTPKDGVFDPFSPAPAHLALAPLSRKCFTGSVGFIARRLQFGSSSSSSLQLEEVEEEQSISDSELLEAVYENLLEVIVSHQAESSLAQVSSSQSDCPDCNTPPTSFMSGVAQTCPPAPVKPSRKLRNLDMGLCRKLEF